MQFDFYFTPLGAGAVSRIQCDIGTFNNCATINADGAVGAAVPAGFDFARYALIPGVLHAYKASKDDLKGLVRPDARHRSEGGHHPYHSGHGHDRD